MGNLRLAAAILFVAACGSDHANTPVDAAIDSKMVDAKVWMDAPPPVYDFSCMNNAAPTNGSAAANITLSGTVTEVDVDLQTQTPVITQVDGATLTACDPASTTCTGQNKLVGPVTSAGGGNFSLGPIATSTNPLDWYISMTRTGDRDTYEYSPQPMIADQDMIPMLTFTPNGMLALGFLSGSTQSNTKGLLAIAVTDCANQPVDGATITVKQNGTAVTGTDDYDLGALNQQAAGVHLIFNVPVGDTEVGATLGNMTFRAHTIHSFANATSATIVRPGYF